MHMRRGWFTVAAIVPAVLMLAAIGGCAASGTFQSGALVSARARGVTLSVVNRNFEDVHVFMLRGSGRLRLGTVEGMGTRQFNISPSRLGSSQVLHLDLVAVPSRAGITMVPVDCEPGQIVEARIGTYLQNSTVGIQVPTVLR